MPIDDENKESANFDHLISERLKSRRLMLGLTQKEISDTLGKHPLHTKV